MDEEEESQGWMFFSIIATVSTFGISLGIITLLLKWWQDKIGYVGFVSKTCSNSKCQSLNHLMVRLVSRELAFQDTRDIKAEVIQHLTEMAEIHGLGNTKDKIACLKDNRKKTEMYQCLRTTLVRHPNDLRGRRRANRARQILMYHVFNDGRDCIYHIESCFKRCYSGLPKGVRKFFKCALLVGKLLWKVALYFVDMYSDFVVLVALFFAYRATTTFNNMETSALQGNTTITNAYKDVAYSCPGATHEDLISAFDKLSDLLSKYKTSLLFAMAPNFFVQCVQSASLIWRIWIFRGRNGLNFTEKKVMYIVPFLNTFTKMFSINWAMEDETKEKEDFDEDIRSFENVDECTRKKYAERQARNTGIIAESFLESQATMKVLLGYYLAFCYITGPGHDKLDCISKTFLKQFGIASLLTIYSEGKWYTLWLPKLAFSSLTSLLSITFGQVNAYKVRHEYDMKISGTVLYIISSALVTFAKVSGQILLFASFYCVILKQDLGYWNELALLQVPHLYPLITTWMSFYIINMHDVYKGRLSGYPLRTKFMPVVEFAGRLNGVRRLNDFNMCAHQETDSVKQNILVRLGLPIHQQIKKLPGGKFINLVLAAAFESGMKLLARFMPHKFSFDLTVKSRVRYQWRFCFAIGKNFILTNLDLLIASLIWQIPGHLKLDLKEINSDGPAWRNTCYIIFGSIGANYLGLLSFWMFFKYGHIWKSKGVSVGYEYAENYDRQEPLPCEQQAMARGYTKEYPNPYPPLWRGLKRFGQSTCRLFCRLLTCLCGFKPCQTTHSDQGGHLGQNIHGVELQPFQPNNSQSENTDDGNRMEQHTQCSSALINATKEGNLDKVGRLIEEERAQVDLQDEDGWTALHWASQNGHLDIAKALLQNGAQVNIQNKYDSLLGPPYSTALHLASQNGHLDVTKALLQSGAQVDLQDEDGWTALHWAYSENNLDIATVLRESGARYPCNPWSVQFEGRWVCTKEM